MDNEEENNPSPQEENETLLLGKGCSPAALKSIVYRSCLRCKAVDDVEGGLINRFHGVVFEG